MNNLLMRQYGFLTPDKWENRTVHIIGCGGLGSPLALMLAKMGAEEVSLYDKDTVEDVNINNQLFGPKDIGKTKVDAVKENIQALSGIQKVNTFHGDVLSQEIILTNNDIVILALDSNDVRMQMYEILISRMFSGLVVDPRMGGLVCSVYSVHGGTAMLDYQKFTPTDTSVPDAVCTEKAIVFNTFGCGAIASEVVRKYLNGQLPESFHHQLDFVNLLLMQILK